VKRNIIVAKNAFSPEYCNNVLEVATKFQIGKINGTGVTNNVDNGEHAPKLRRSTVSWIDNNIDSCDIFHPIYKLTREVNNKFFQFDIKNVEVIQVTRYDSENKGFYSPHIDGMYEDITQPFVRKLSMSVQLTPPEYYEGGRLHFPDDEEKFIVTDSLAQGTAVFFPSYMKHGVKPVTEGIRNSIVCWFLGEHFR
jgi:PKHD-type hydroxylase